MTGRFCLTTVLFSLILLFGWGCSSGYVPLIHTGSSLNIYNTYWDDFDGRMEIGRIYHYSNRKYDRKLHFRVEKILEDGRVVVGRRAENGRIDEKQTEISEECRFLISTSYPYADGIKLREGDYRCIGNARYETEDGLFRTAYLLEDLSWPARIDRDRHEAAEPGKKDEKQMEEKKMILGNSPCVPLRFSADSLNICNTVWDHFTGSLKTDKVYSYRNAGFCRELHYKVIQSEPGMGVLVARKAATGKIDGEIRDMCAGAVFLIVSGHSYADGESLRDGEYRCLGTYRYGRGTDAEQTLYVLMDTGNPGTLPAELKRVPAQEKPGKKTEFSI